jgi:solute carrier family 44 (choline transporter-like protein), member 2/4/5
VFFHTTADILGLFCLLQAISDALPSVIDPTVVDRTTWKWIAIASAIVAGLILILTLLSITRVRIAVACIKVSRIGSAWVAL